MKKPIHIMTFVLVILLVPSFILGSQLPSFTAKTDDLWINSKALKTDELKGKVVLVEVWTST